jgi:hypothetical protein
MCAERKEADREKLREALESLKKAGVAFRGPFSSSKGELVVVESAILRATEVVELFTAGKLTREGIQEYLRREEKRKSAGSC